MKLVFEEFTLDLDRRLLLEGDSLLHLSPKALDLLALLIRHRPKALSKEEIFKELWPETFVSENAIATLIADIRTAIKDDARRPRFISTVHTHGYAFCGAAAGDEAAAPIVNHASETAAAPWSLIWDAREIPLSFGENILGRSGDGVVVLESVTVSRHHARLVVAADSITVEDMGSKNGTWLGNDQVTTPVPVKDGDRLRLGSVVLIVRAYSPSSSTATVGLPRL